MPSSQGNDSAASGAADRPSDLAEVNTAAIMPPDGQAPGPYPRSVADVLDTFTHDRLLAELDRAHEQIAHLEAAVESNRDIGTAMGILMGQGGLTKEQAFERLRIASQDSHRKLRDIAADVVKGDRLPQPLARGAATAPIPRPPNPRPPG